MTDIADVDLNLLSTLSCLLEERSVTRAAARLRLSQPTVSGRLAQLRELFGDALFVRAGRGLVPTPRAEALRPELARFVESARSALETPFLRPSESAATLRLSANDYICVALIAPFIAELRREAPRVRVILRPMLAGDLSAALRDGTLDLAVTVSDFVPDDARTRRLFEERYVCAVRRQHPIRGHRVSTRRYCEFDHIVVSPGGSLRGPMDDALGRGGASRRVVASLPDFSALPALLEADDLIAIVPERFLAHAGHRLRSFSPPVETPGFAVTMAWHSRTHHDPTHRWLRELLATTAERVAP